MKRKICAQETESSRSQSLQKGKNDTSELRAGPDFLFVNHVLEVCVGVQVTDRSDCCCGLPDELIVFVINIVELELGSS